MSFKKVILITGPNGFIGKQFLKEINLNFEYTVKAISRSFVKEAQSQISYNDFIMGNFNNNFFEDVEVVVHLASVAHKFNRLDANELKSVNSDYLSKLLAVLNPHRLDRFLFMSSYAVTLLEQKKDMDTAHYARLKAKSELELKEASNGKFTKTNFIILRPPLVYGKNAPGNFQSLFKLISKPIVLPFGDFTFKRSFIHLRNLTSFMLSILTQNPLSSKFSIIEVSDPWDENFLSFITRLKKSLKSKVLILYVPKKLIEWGLKMLGKQQLYNKLSLEFNIDYKVLIDKFQWNYPVKREDSFNDI